MNVLHSRVSKSNLDNVPITDGQIILTKDTKELYVDLGENRSSISDFIYVEDITTLNKEDANQYKVYFANKQNNLYRYNATTSEFVPLLKDTLHELDELEKLVMALGQNVTENHIAVFDTTGQVIDGGKTINEIISDALPVWQS